LEPRLGAVILLVPSCVAFAAVAKFEDTLSTCSLGFITKKFEGAAAFFFLFFLFLVCLPGEVFFLASPGLLSCSGEL
jgi:hypothetical protein